MVTFALIHSPLVGPYTWALVADAMGRRGIRAVVPNLHEQVQAGTPFWAQHASAVARALAPEAESEPVVLVGHSGAGMLLPASRERLGRAVAGYIFVDAGLPEDGKSRLDLFWDREAAAGFRQVASGGFLPPWTSDDLKEVIPDAAVRVRFVSELRPTPIAVYEEPLPVFQGWPDAPGGYLQFSKVYDSAAEQARRMGWAYRKLDAGHFHMLVEPEVVTNALIELAGEMIGVGEGLF
jgi:pimeloyl-ACP methyl ester carboxylesterase